MASGNLIVIGSSTGGLKVLEAMFTRLPVLKAAVLIVQHITPVIDQAFVTSLSRVSAMPVFLARSGQQLDEGNVYLAPGGIHLTLQQNSICRLTPGEKVNSVCPAIDVAMKSLVRTTSGRLVGIILTGMGYDGAAGIVQVKKCGGLTIAQDQKSSIIFGMPKAAAETGMVDLVLSTDRIADKLRELFG